MCSQIKDMMSGWRMPEGIPIPRITFTLMMMMKNSGISGTLYYIVERKSSVYDLSSFLRVTFRWDEVGRYDVPASINYILLKTGRDKLSYIGHSMGCGVFFIAMLTHPELQGKVEMMAALAPATSMANMRNILRRVAPFNDEFMVNVLHLFIE